jgi:hypothetical protein
MKAKIVLKKVLGVLALLIAGTVLILISYKLFKGIKPFTFNTAWAICVQSVILFQGLRWLREK